MFGDNTVELRCQAQLSTCVRTIVAVLVAALGVASSACHNGSTTPTANANFTILSGIPPFQGTVLGTETTPSNCNTAFDAIGCEQTGNLTLNFEVSYDTKPVYNVNGAPQFVIELMRGSTECLRTAIAYSTPTTSVGNTFGFTVSDFHRDIGHPACGTSFTTDSVLFILSTNSGQTLFTQAIAGGWTFTFMP